MSAERRFMRMVGVGAYLEVGVLDVLDCVAIRSDEYGVVYKPAESIDCESWFGCEQGGYEVIIDDEAWPLGYSYLRMVRAEVRQEVADRLGPAPTVKALFALFDHEMCGSGELRELGFVQTGAYSYEITHEGGNLLSLLKAFALNGYVEEATLFWLVIALTEDEVFTSKGWWYVSDVRDLVEKRFGDGYCYTSMISTAALVRVAERLGSNPSLLSLLMLDDGVFVSSEQMQQLYVTQVSPRGYHVGTEETDCTLWAFWGSLVHDQPWGPESMGRYIRDCPDIVKKFGTVHLTDTIGGIHRKKKPKMVTLVGDPSEGDGEHATRLQDVEFAQIEWISRPDSDDDFDDFVERCLIGTEQATVVDTRNFSLASAAWYDVKREDRQRAVRLTDCGVEYVIGHYRHVKEGYIWYSFVVRSGRQPSVLVVPPSGVVVPRGDTAVMAVGGNDCPVLVNVRDMVEIYIGMPFGDGSRAYPYAAVPVFITPVVEWMKDNGKLESSLSVDSTDAAVAVLRAPALRHALRTCVLTPSEIQSLDSTLVSSKYSMLVQKGVVYHVALKQGIMGLKFLAAPRDGQLLVGDVVRVNLGNTALIDSSVLAGGFQVLGVPVGGEVTVHVFYRKPIVSMHEDRAVNRQVDTNAGSHRCTISDCNYTGVSAEAFGLHLQMWHVSEDELAREWLAKVHSDNKPFKPGASYAKVAHETVKAYRRALPYECLWEFCSRRFKENAMVLDHITRSHGLTPLDMALGDHSFDFVRDHTFCFDRSEQLDLFELDRADRLAIPGPADMIKIKESARETLRPNSNYLKVPLSNASLASGVAVQVPSVVKACVGLSKMSIEDDEIADMDD